MPKRPIRFARRAAVVSAVAALGVVGLAATPASAAGPTWIERDQLSTGGLAVSGAEVAVDLDGNAVALWASGEGDASELLAAVRAPGGSWSAPETVVAVPNVSDARLAVGGNGVATAVWRDADIGGDMRVRAAQRSTEGAWSAPETLSTHAPESPAVAADEAGNVIASWASADGLRAAYKPAAAAWGSPATVTSVVNTEPKVTIDDGRSVVAWEASGVNARYRSSSGTWGTAVKLASAAVDPHVAIDGNGVAVAVWRGTTSGRIFARVRATNGAWGEGAPLSSQSLDAFNPQVALNDDGDAVIAWTVAVAGAGRERVQAGTRLTGGPWTGAVYLSASTHDASGTQAAIDGAGHAVVVWKDGDGQQAKALSAHLSPGGSWSPTSPVSDPAVTANADAPRIAFNEAGDAAAVWQESSEVQAAELTGSAPVAAMNQPALTRQTSKSFVAGWTTAEFWDAVTSYDVRYRQAAWNGDFGTQTAWKDATTATSATLSGTPGQTYCFSTRARDGVNGAGPWSAERCAATPVDDRLLVRSGTWTRGTSSSFYEGTFTRGETNGAALTRTGVQAKHISLLATTCSSCGSVRVSFNGTSLGTFSLVSSSTVNKKLITVKTFDTVQTGTLKIQITSATGKRVYIDGVVARRS